MGWCRKKERLTTMGMMRTVQGLGLILEISRNQCIMIISYYRSETFARCRVYPV